MLKISLNCLLQVAGDRLLNISSGSQYTEHLEFWNSVISKTYSDITLRFQVCLFIHEQGALFTHILGNRSSNQDKWGRYNFRNVWTGERFFNKMCGPDHQRMRDEIKIKKGGGEFEAYWNNFVVFCPNNWE